MKFAVLCIFIITAGGKARLLKMIVIFENQILISI